MRRATIANRQTVFAVLRAGMGGDVIVAVSNSLERAEELAGEYEQMFLDKGFKDEFTFYVTGTVFYV